MRHLNRFMSCCQVTSSLLSAQLMFLRARSDFDQPYTSTRIASLSLSLSLFLSFFLSFFLTFLLFLLFFSLSLSLSLSPSLSITSASKKTVTGKATAAVTEFFRLSNAASSPVFSDLKKIEWDHNSRQTALHDADPAFGNRWSELRCGR